MKKIENSERDEFLDAIRQADRHLNLLLAQLVALDHTLLPSRSPAWPTVLKLHGLLARYRTLA